MRAPFRQLLFLILVVVVAPTLQAGTFTYSYDALNRITNAAYADGARESYAFDNAGNRLWRVTAGASTNSDAVAPSTPMNLATYSLSPRQVQLGWNRSFDTGGSGLAGYLVYLNGLFYTNATTTNIVLTGLAPDSYYCVAVVAHDRQNNTSAPSTNLCFNSPASVRALTWSSELEIGNVKIGQISHGSFGVVNIGNEPITVSSVVYPEGFSGTWHDGVLLPGGYASTYVTFAPTRYGSYSNNITITSDADESPLLIPVWGFGVYPLHITQARLRTDGFMEFLLEVEPGIYRIEASTNLSNWNPISTNTISSSLLFIDLQTMSFAHRFYRVLKIE